MMTLRSLSSSGDRLATAARTFRMAALAAGVFASSLAPAEAGKLFGHGKTKQCCGCGDTACGACCGGAAISSWDGPGELPVAAPAGSGPHPFAAPAIPYAPSPYAGMPAPPPPRPPLPPVLPPPGTLGRTYLQPSRPIPDNLHPRMGVLEVYGVGDREVTVDGMKGFRDDDGVWRFESKAPLVPGVLPLIYEVRARTPSSPAGNEDVRVVRLIPGRIVRLDF